MLDLRPKFVAASQRLQEPISHCDVVADMDAVRRKVKAYCYQKPLTLLILWLDTNMLKIILYRCRWKSPLLMVFQYY
jgi:hypothetical protein